MTSIKSNLIPLNEYLSKPGVDQGDAVVNFFLHHYVAYNTVAKQSIEAVLELQHFVTQQFKQIGWNTFLADADSVSAIRNNIDLFNEDMQKDLLQRTR